APLTFSPTGLYPIHAGGPRLWNLTPLEDQQLAGSIMWIPPGLQSLVTMVALAHAWLTEADRRSRGRDQAQRRDQPQRADAALRREEAPPSAAPETLGLAAGLEQGSG